MCYDGRETGNDEMRQGVCMRKVVVSEFVTLDGGSGWGGKVRAWRLVYAVLAR